MLRIQCSHCEARYKVPPEMAGKKVRCRKCKQPIQIPSLSPTAEPQEVSDGGSVIHRHAARTSGFEFATGDSENIERISDHIERHIGKVSSVYHEVLSDLVHIDIHIVEPTNERPFYTLITSGMSDRRMSPPEEASHLGYAELCLCLPPNWSMGEDALKNEENYWPVYWLKFLARFPHEYQTWIFDGHTIPNSDPPEPLHPSVPFCGWMLSFPILVPEEFIELKIDSDKSIYFLAILPLYESEMNFKLKKGAEKLMQRMDKKQVSEIIDISRKDVTKGIWPFG